MVKIAEQIDLTDAIAFAERHFSTTPTASDAFAQVSFIGAKRSCVVLAIITNVVFPCRLR